MKGIDVIILSWCKDESYFDLNKNCIQSLISSENEFLFNIVVVESNRNWTDLEFCYEWPNVKVLTPRENFNYNRFLNIGIRSTSNNLVVLANNDVVFHKKWLSEILKVKSERPDIISFCPFDRDSAYLSWDRFKDKKFVLGYRVPIEFVGWCVVIERAALEKIRLLDEQFDLYFQDNDFSLTLRANQLTHALVPSSYVHHLGGMTTNNPDPSSSEKYKSDKALFERKWQKYTRKNLTFILENFVERIKRNILNAYRYFKTKT